MELDMMPDLDPKPSAVNGELDNFSPCRTRSGCVYESGLKKRKFRRYPKKSKKLAAAGAVGRNDDTSSSGGRTRALSGQSGTGSVADCSENGSEVEDNSGFICDRLEFDEPHSPPPLNYTKNVVSRFTLPRERKYRHDIPSSPISHHIAEHELSSPPPKAWGGLAQHESPILSFSPPTNNMRAMRLFDGLSSPNTACALTSPRSTPRAHFLKSRLLFGDEEIGAGGEHRRASLPNTQVLECDSMAFTSTVKRKIANINPFTPAAMMLASKKRSRSKRSLESSVGSSREELQASLDSLEASGVTEDVEPDACQAKRVRVSDISITRYECEFLEIDEIASGQFGTVKKARHRLDGIVYAIKISKKALRVNSHDEKMAMNEVFAHAAIMKHKHVVRYYNSWVEKGQVYIQNEYCEGGSLQNKIQEMKMNRSRFSEAELKKLIVHVAKGLQYIHSKQLVHLDIKPGNIFISLQYCTPSPHPRADQSTDSGAASGDHSAEMDELASVGGGGSSVNGSVGGGSSCNSSPGTDGEKLQYKIGDLGHVASVSVYGGDVSPEEGDCRYMAPEFLEMEVERAKLSKADIFSLGLTVYEAASLRSLPRNSLDDPDYEKLKMGELPFLPLYSREFNLLLRSMVQPDPASRPSASKLLSNSSLNPSMNKTRSQLYKELKAARDKVAQLEQQILNSSAASTPSPQPQQSITVTASAGGVAATTNANREFSIGTNTDDVDNYLLHDKENNAPAAGTRKIVKRPHVGRSGTKTRHGLL